MKYLIFSDIHSNLEALRTVLSDAERHGPDRILCLGDFVGYAANPRECVQTVRGIPEATAVLGNHDAAVLDPAERSMFNQFARAGIIYSESQLDTETVVYLRGLPMLASVGDDYIAVHASPWKPESWIYVLEPLEAADAFHAMTTRVAFIGHTHYPALHTDDGSMRPFLPGEKISLNGDNRMLINVGSVGQPRDGDPRAAYVIVDIDDQTAEIFRVEYDIDTTAKKILDAGLPTMLADRLRRGY